MLTAHIPSIFKFSCILEVLIYIVFMQAYGLKELFTDNYYIHMYAFASVTFYLATRM